MEQLYQMLFQRKEDMKKREFSNFEVKEILKFTLIGFIEISIDNILFSSEKVEKIKLPNQ